MATFEDAISIVMLHEGGFVDDPDDSGGATNFGISLRFLLGKGIDINHDGTVDVQDIKDLTYEQAENLYRQYFWKPLYEQILDQTIATKLFDFGVNADPKEAIIICQRGLADAGHAVVVDGLFGPGTLAAINACDPTRFLYDYSYEIDKFYQDLVQHHASYGKFLKGWRKRAWWPADNPPVAIDSSMIAE